MKKQFFFTTFFGFCFIFGVFSFAQQSATLKIIHLECHKTTERSEDEVYFIISGKTNRGKNIIERVPGYNHGDHWDMNDGKKDANRNIRNRQVFTMNLDSGEIVQLNVLMMEEDGGTSKEWQQLAGAILIKIPDPTGTCQTIGSISLIISPFLNFKDRDDFIGSFAVTIQNKDGVLITQWAGLDQVEKFQSNWENHCNWFWLMMNGDGAYYGAVFSVE